MQDGVMRSRGIEVKQLRDGGKGGMKGGARVEERERGIRRQDGGCAESEISVPPLCFPLQ